MEAEELAGLIETYAAPLELYARQWCADPADVVQSAFIRLIEQDPPPDHPGPWLYRVVRNAALSQRRSDQRRHRHEADARQMTGSWFEPSLESGLDGEAATQALHQLADEQREVVIARLWGGLTFQQISQLMQVATSTAHRRYEDGICALRKHLGVPCQNHE